MDALEITETAERGFLDAFKDPAQDSKSDNDTGTTSQRPITTDRNHAKGGGQIRADAAWRRKKNMCSADAEKYVLRKEKSSPRARKERSSSPRAHEEKRSGEAAAGDECSEANGDGT